MKKLWLAFGLFQFLIAQPNGTWVAVAASCSNGVCTMQGNQVTTTGTQSNILVPQPNGTWVQLPALCSGAICTLVIQ